MGGGDGMADTNGDGDNAGDDGQVGRERWMSREGRGRVGKEREWEAKVVEEADSCLSRLYRSKGRG